MSGPAWNEALVIAGGIHCALFAVFHLLAVVVVLSFACAYGAQVLGVGPCGPSWAAGVFLIAAGGLQIAAVIIIAVLAWGVVRRRMKKPRAEQPNPDVATERTEL